MGNFQEFIHQKSNESDFICDLVQKSIDEWGECNYNDKKYFSPVHFTILDWKNGKGEK